MSNAFAVKPEVAEPHIPDVWTDPVTGISVPKTPEANLRWRMELLEAAEKDESMQADLWAACKSSILFYVNAFCYTFRIHEVDEEGNAIPAVHQDVPWITWPVQDRHILALQEKIRTGKSMLTDKTRDMGASWNHIVAFHHEWLFVPNSLFLVMSRVENDVDGADNPRCLFVKLDYLNKWLPDWMRPPGVLSSGKNRTRMHLINELNGSRIDGESSNKAAGSGDRRKAVLLDEFAKMDNATKIKSSLRDVSPCLLPNSIPFGAGTAYSKWRMSGQIDVFQLPWWEHPEKARGLYVDQDQTTGKWKIRSLWYDRQEEERSPQEMAQEIDMDHIGSGSTFFEGTVVEQHRALFARDPVFIRNIDFSREVPTSEVQNLLRRKRVDKVEVWKARTGRNPWRFWTHFSDERKVGANRGRLDQNKTYVVGADISKGQGASNSVLSVWCLETKEKVAEYADANTPPYDLARIAVAACLWIGGRGGLPTLIWEANGPGWDFGRQVVTVYKYPKYYIDRAVGTPDEKVSKRYGWHSSREKKEAMLGAYRRALAHGGFINHSKEALDEAETYVYFDDGTLGPAELVEENQDARKTHGDRVIADALCVWAGEGHTTKRPFSQPKAPHNSFAGRMKRRINEQKQRRKSLKFDFRKGIMPNA